MLSERYKSTTVDRKKHWEFSLEQLRSQRNNNLEVRPDARGEYATAITTVP